MTEQDDRLIIVGRGHSAHDFSWPTDATYMAVSSGIYVIPRRCRPSKKRPDAKLHFVTMDHPKYFMEPLVDHPTAWTFDEKVKLWPFWAEHRVIKHVQESMLKLGTCRYFDWPVAIKACTSEKMLRDLYKEFHDVQDEFGWQPGWADYSSVFSWPVEADENVNFEDRPVGFSGVRNSLMFSIQIAYRMNYRRILFVGVDLPGERYACMARGVRDCVSVSIGKGMIYGVSSKDSSLSEFLPVCEWFAPEKDTKPVLIGA